MMKDFLVIKKYCIFFLLYGKITKEGEWLMIKEIAWNTFKNTGSINTFLELKQIENFENVNNQKVNFNEYSKNEGNNNCRK